jgi:SAM-dependent methyltransferase
MEVAIDRTPALPQIIADVCAYYDGKIALHGPSARGVDWNSTASQELRFAQLLKVVESFSSYSLTDFGCGYGALAEFVAASGGACSYRGFDISQQMIEQAWQRHAGRTGCTFFSDPALLSPTDYTVASGIFNVRLHTSSADWEWYFLDTLHRIHALSLKGFSFNALTSYSDADRMRSDLYYADPCWLFDYCKRHFSRSVALLHDYGLYEFTILVRK